MAKAPKFTSRLVKKLRVLPPRAPAVPTAIKGKKKRKGR